MFLRLTSGGRDKAPSSVQDQIFDRQSNTVRYYLDREVRFNTMAVFLGCPSNETVQRLVRLMTLIADPSAPTAINPVMSAEQAKSKSFLSLSAESRAITKRLQKRYGSAKLSPDN